MRVYLEVGRQKTFASAVDWPGWSRAAKTEELAVAALGNYASRYGGAMSDQAVSLGWAAGDIEFELVERLVGNATTDFGAPGVIAQVDRGPLDDAELDRQLKLLTAAWSALDRSTTAATGKTLATGPRGGGRSLDKILDHAIEADRAYIAALGARAPGSRATLAEVHDAFIEALHAKTRGELPDVGPRGGERWPARYAIRRSAWHVLDHAWEIEDRLV